MNKLIVRTLGGAALLVVAVVSGFNPGTARPAHADPTNIFLVNQGICLALTSSTFAGCVFPGSLGYSNTSGDANLLAAANALGNNNGVIEPSDFTNVANLGGQGSKSGAQIHQADGSDGSATNVLAVIAFVANDAPVTFHTNAGFFIESQSATWFCNGTPAPASQQNADSDCGRGPLNSPVPVLNEDHVVVATLACSLATCPNLGPAELTVEQDGIIFPMKFTVVGEPRTVQFFTLEKAIQAGVPVIGTLSNRGNGPTEPNPCVPPVCTPVATACPFAANIDFITKALAQAEKTVVVARALDINGTSIAGAWIDWTVDNAGVGTNTATFNKDNSIPTNFDSQGILSQPITPTLNLGGFGFGAPNILCAPANAVAGKVTVRATLTPSTPGSPGADVDPGAAFPLGATSGAWAETTFNVNAIPAKLTLTADPPSIPCDGTTTSTVSAALADAAGNPAISGTAVSFSSPILGTANPLSTTTNDKGIATSVITPLSSGQAGTTVVVSVAVGGVNQTNLTQSILVQCGAAAPAGAAPGGAAPGGAPGAAGAAPIGITAPNTGSGPLGAGAAAGLTWWPALALIAAAGALATARFALKRAR
ncbi:MAG: Ig-like domain-containing protein [Dehalococcoidia bacterium]